MQDVPAVSDNASHPVIGLLAGEASGDILGAGLISELKLLYPAAEFVGIGGPLMQRAGLKSLHDMERLAVMGFVEPLKRLPELLGIRSSIVEYFIANPPSVFIGIDAPDFNLGVEKRLKRAGIKTVHYVSPSVWAWRQWRMKKIKAAVDHMLCVFPFEAEFYEKRRLPVTFVGHPMADEISLEVDKPEAKRRLGLTGNGLTVAVLPGSRSKEVEMLGPLFMQVAKQIQENTEVGEIVVAAASQSAYDRIQSMATAAGADIRIFLGRARDVLLAADVGLAASGTVTLEAMLTKTPLVVAYRLEKLSYWIAHKLVKLKYISLPNILADEGLMSEHIQDNARVESISADLQGLIGDELRRDMVCASFLSLHNSIRKEASARAAEAVANLIEQNNDG